MVRQPLSQPTWQEGRPPFPTNYDIKLNYHLNRQLTLIVLIGCFQCSHPIQFFVSHSLRSLENRDIHPLQIIPTSNTNTLIGNSFIPSPFPAAPLSQPAHESTALFFLSNTQSNYTFSQNSTTEKSTLSEWLRRQPRLLPRSAPPHNSLDRLQLNTVVRQPPSPITWQEGRPPLYKLITTPTLLTYLISISA